MNQQEKSFKSAIYIIEAGIDEFADKGRLISLNGICQNHGISKGKLYHHFSSKDELLCACVCHALDKLTADIDDYQIDDSISIKDNFHNYYMERINHWTENPNELIVLRLAYSLRRKIFSDESLKKMQEYQNEWRQAKKYKILQIIHSKNNTLRINDESIAEIMLLMYENTFQVLEDKVISSVKSGDAKSTEEYTKQLIAYHDTIINMILYGAFEN